MKTPYDDIIHLPHPFRRTIRRCRSANGPHSSRRLQR